MAQLVALDSVFGACVRVVLVVELRYGIFWVGIGGSVVVLLQGCDFSHHIYGWEASWPRGGVSGKIVCFIEFLL